MGISISTTTDDTVFEGDSGISDQASHEGDPFQVPVDQVDPTPFETASDYQVLRTRQSSHTGIVTK